MFGVMLLTILFGALVHVHGVFWLGLLPCLGLLAGYAHTAVYGMWEWARWLGRLYVRVKVIPDEYFIIDRTGTKRVQWVELGTVTRKGKTGFTFTVASLTFQLGWQPPQQETQQRSGTCNTMYTDSNSKTSRPLTPEESQAISEYMNTANGYVQQAFAEVTKVFDKLKKDGKA